MPPTFDPLLLLLPDVLVLVVVVVDDLGAEVTAVTVLLPVAVLVCEELEEPSEPHPCRAANMAQAATMRVPLVREMETKMGILPYGIGIFTASLVLAIMIIPGGRGSMAWVAAS